MNTRFHSLKNSLTLRTTLMVLAAQTIPIFLLFLLIMQDRSFESNDWIVYDIREVENIFFSAEGLDLFSKSPDFLEENSIERDNPSSVSLENAKREFAQIQSDNPDLWYDVRSGDRHYTLGRKPVFLDTTLQSLKNNPLFATECMSTHKFFLEERYKVTNYTYSCKGDILVYSEFGGLKKNYTLPNDFNNQLPTVNKQIELLLQLLALLIALIVTPTVLYLQIRPIGEISKAASRIGQGKLGERLPKDKAFTELQGLITSANTALERLDQGYIREQRFRDAIAHELRTPLTLLRGRLEEVQDTALRNALVEDIKRLNDLIERILNFARTASETVQLEQVNLDELLRGVCADCGAMALKNDVELNFEVPTEDEVIVRTGRMATYLIFINILNNAIKHGPNGNVVALSLRQDGLVTITDRGPGLRNEQLQFLNNASDIDFTRSSRALSGGIGLYIVTELIRYIDGSLSARSRPNGGTEVIISVGRPIKKLRL